MIRDLTPGLLRFAAALAVEVVARTMDPDDDITWPPYLTAEDRAALVAAAYHQPNTWTGESGPPLRFVALALHDIALESATRMETP